MPYRPSAVRNQTSSTAPLVPNLTPVMNLFLTIIPFLIEFTIIAEIALIALNFGPSTGSGPGSGNPLWVIIRAPSSASAQAFEIREPGSSVTIGMVNGQYDYGRLDQEIKRLRTEYSSQLDINVAPEAQTVFDALIKTIDLCRSNGYVNIHYRPAI